MSDLELKAFLEKVGLLEHFNAFVSERIELRDLMQLSEAELITLGLPLGHRRRLQQAIGEIEQERLVPQMERRNLTVLFCDMVNSTAVASILDPEELHALYRAFRDSCVKAIEAEGGFVAHKLGDGLMAHFGFPHAMEDAAVRAVRAGLGIVSRVDAMTPVGDFEVDVRVGIASGMTVIENFGVRGITQDEAVTGATLALAARIQALAPPGGIVVSNITRRLLGDTFALDKMGERAIKGFPDKQSLWLVKKIASPERDRRLETKKAKKLVDRVAELSVLLDAWQRCREGKGATIIVRGEAGIGKSRIITELMNRSAGTGDITILQCSRYAQGAAFQPIMDWLKAGADSRNIGGGNSSVRLPGVPPESAELLEPIFNVINTGAASDDVTLERQQEIIGILVDLLAPAAANPTAAARLICVEDAQWVDEATLVVLNQLATRTVSSPLLLVITSRPDMDRLPEGPGVRCLSLGPLSTESTRALVKLQSRAEDLAEPLIGNIVQRSSGIPLFIEELTRSVLESSDGHRLNVPISLQDTLMARLDRLKAGKHVAQIAAVLGSRFSWDVLTTCAGLPKSALRKGLNELLGASLVERISETEYAFRHALLRDAAYLSLLRAHRIEFHRKVADVLEVEFPDIVTNSPEILAHHWTEAGEIDAALRYWERAAERNIARAAPTAALTCFESAIDLLLQMPPSSSRNRREVDLRLRLNMPLTIVQGFASPMTEANIKRLADLLEATEGSKAALQLLWSTCMSALVRSDLVPAKTTALHLKRAATRADLPNAQRTPDRMLGYIAMLEGELDIAERHFAWVLEGYLPSGFDPIMPGHPFDVLASSLAQRAIIMALRNRSEVVDSDQARALQRARALQNTATTFQVLVHLCIARIEMDDVDALVPLLEELRDLVNRNEITPLYADIWDAWLRGRAGDLDTALNDMAEARSNGQQYQLWLPRTFLMQADLLIGAARWDEALGLIDECDNQIARFRHSYLLAASKRRRASCIAALGGKACEVKALLSEAVAISRMQGAERFEIEATRDLDRWQRNPEY